MRVRWALLAAVAASGLAGCFSEILPTQPGTRLGFVCAALDPGRAEELALESWVGDGSLGTHGAEAALARELGHAGLREGGVRLERHAGPDAPRGGWDDESLRAWAEERPALGRGGATLRVLWAGTLPGGASTLSPAPGLVAVSQAAVREGAARLGVAEADVARAVLLHGAGHALGAVNLGVPVQDPDIQEREGPAGHDPDPASVLHAGWDAVGSMAWVANATYDRFPGAVHADWDAAARPGGACP